MYDAIRRGSETDGASAARIGLTSYFALIDVADKHRSRSQVGTPVFWKTTDLHMMMEKLAGHRPSDKRVERVHSSSMISAVDLHAVFLLAEPPHVPSDPPSRPSI